MPPIQIGTEEPDTDDEITTIASETDAPGGVSFSQPRTLAAAINLGTLASGDMYGLWLKRVIPKNAESDPSIAKGFDLSFGAA